SDGLSSIKSSLTRSVCESSDSACDSRALCSATLVCIRYSWGQLGWRQSTSAGASQPTANINQSKRVASWGENQRERTNYVHTFAEPELGNRVLLHALL